MGEFVVTYDLEDARWAYVRLIGEGKFSGSGLDTTGREFQADDLNSLDLLIRILGREGFLRERDTGDEKD